MLAADMNPPGTSRKFGACIVLQTPARRSVLPSRNAGNVDTDHQSPLVTIHIFRSASSRVPDTAGRPGTPRAKVYYPAARSGPPAVM